MSRALAACPVCGDAPVPHLCRPDLRIVRSPGCGLQWVQPMPDARGLRELYGGAYFERWGVDGPEALARVRRMKESTYRAFLREIRQYRSSGRLLDVGCAFGFFVGAALQAGFDAYGVELNPGAAAAARRELGERVRQGALDRDVFDGAAFDVITLIDVFEHLPEPAQLLRAARERLSPSGILVAVLPNAGSWTRRLFGRRWPHYAPEHLYYWSPSNLRRFLTEAGWRTLGVRTALRKTYTGTYLSAYADRLGQRLPPGVRWLGHRQVRLPTGEMLVVATPR